MAYADQKRNRTVALGSVALVHIGLGAALLTGLAVKFERPPTTIFEGENVPVETPPPPDEPPPEPKIERVETPTRPVETIVAPVPRVATVTTIDLPTTNVLPPPTPILNLGPVTPAESPAPPPANLSRALQPRGSQGDWFPQDSYPAAARRAGAEGRVSVSVDVGANGRVAACRVAVSSGNEELDQATCRLATRNGRFTPALDAAGQATPATVTLRPVRWRLEQ